MPESTIRKLHPKLRMFENGTSAVNAARSTICSAMTTRSEPLRPPIDVRKAPAGVARSKAKKGRVKEPADNVLVNVFVHTTNGQPIPGAEDFAVGAPVRRGQMMTMTVPLNRLRAIAEAKNVTHIEAG